MVNKTYLIEERRKMEMQAIIEVRKPVRCESCGEILAWERVNSHQVQYMRGAIVNNIYRCLVIHGSAWCKIYDYVIR